MPSTGRIVRIDVESTVILPPSVTRIKVEIKLWAKENCTPNTPLQGYIVQWT